MVEEAKMTHHDHEVVERGSGAVAAVAIVVLVILAILAVVAFGGLNWLRNNGGGGSDTNTNEGDNPSVLPTVVVPTVVLPTAAPPASFWSPAGAGAAFG
jgi:hypothetical protein